MMDSEQNAEQHSEIKSAKKVEMTHDSMVTVRLSEPQLSINTKTGGDVPEEDSEQQVSAEGAGLDDTNESPRITMQDPSGNEAGSPSSRDAESRRGSDSSEGSDRVNWEELEKTEEREPRDQGSDDSTALLLARLEQENNLLAKNPKSGITKVQSADKQHSRSKSRPPSIQHLKRLVTGPTPPALRYSMIPAPPMTDLEFYAALVQDYARTAQYLPTLLAKKIRSGIPPPLRGVVWQSMSGARDRLLEDQFDQLCQESSPYEGMIGKDIGRSFPGVEMFRDPEGDGQRMLARVLKCFSLYDQKIGYCQGLGFLVGPLLMHMGDKQAFCVLVRLMEHYDLRNCFLPDLSGLHVRIHQFRELLKQHLPTLSSHLDVLQIEPAYVSQWFLSFFAVTCPLPMLFRIYDVIFAEGASETIMRVAMSLMRKNEEKILACSEFEDVMQLLLSRGLWDCYHYNADEFVNDFVSLSGVVTHESLQALQANYRESLAVDTANASETIGSAAQRFLGRLWAGPNSATKSATLSPTLIAPSRPVSYLRRTPSKQSLASTMNSTEGGASDSMLSSSTEATSISRDSSNTDGSSLRVQSVSYATATTPKMNKDQNLHGQIEDLLTALSEMQRDHAILATQLQREREEREEDRKAVRSLLDGLKTKISSDTMTSEDSEASQDTIKATDAMAEEEIATDDEELQDHEDDEELEGHEDDEKAEGQNAIETTIEAPSPTDSIPEESNDASHLTPPATNLDLSHLLAVVEERFFPDPALSRRSSMLQSKSQLRDELARSKEQLIIEVSKSQDFSRRLLESTQEISSLKDQLREAHIRIQNAHADKQRLEKQILDLRQDRKLSIATSDNGKDDNEWPSVKLGSAGGLRELKLSRSPSTRSQNTATYGKRTSSLSLPAIIAAQKEHEASEQASPSEVDSKKDVDVDVLVLELVQAKTAEAVAKQDAEESRAKLESLRKLLGMPSPSPTDGDRKPSLPPPSERVSAFSSLSLATSARKLEREEIKAPVSAVVGGFWGGWGKRSVSSVERRPCSRRPIGGSFVEVK